jgi:hypothetical protein
VNVAFALFIFKVEILKEPNLINKLILQTFKATQYIENINDTDKYKETLPGMLLIYSKS